jgi:hypothetical protein
MHAHGFDRISKNILQNSLDFTFNCMRFSSSNVIHYNTNVLTSYGFFEYKAAIRERKISAFKIDKKNSGISIECYERLPDPSPEQGWAFNALTFVTNVSYNMVVFVKNNCYV